MEVTNETKVEKILNLEKDENKVFLEDDKKVEMVNMVSGI